MFVRNSKGVTEKRLSPVGKVIVFIVAVLLMSWLWQTFAKNPLRSTAEKMSVAMLHGNARDMIQAMPEEEIGCSNLTEEKLQAIWTALMKSDIESSKKLGCDPADQSAHPTQASADCKLVDRNGQPWRITAIANQTDHGGKALAVYPMIMFASHNKGGRTEETRSLERSLADLLLLEPELQRLGVERFLIGPGQCTSLQALAAQYREGIEIGKAREKKNTATSSDMR